MYLRKRTSVAPLKPPRPKNMASNRWTDFWSKLRVKKCGKQDGTAASIDVSVSASPETTRITTPNVEAPRVGPSHRSVSPTRQPTPAVQISPPPTHLPQISDIRERVWSRAYNDLRKEDPKLVKAYETFFCEPGDGKSRSRHSESRTNEIEQMNIEDRRLQMARLVGAGLENTEIEAAVKSKIKGGVDVISSVKKLIDVAVYSVPQAAPAWAAVSLVLQVSFPPNCIIPC